MNTKKCLKYRLSEGKIWSIIFNHPLRYDSSGQKGRLMRRSLQTTDSKIADKLVDEMKALLLNESLHTESGKAGAQTRYDPIIISAFYDSINPQVSNNDTISIRENMLPLPSTEDGYNRILIMGKTGAGKSTILRHLIDTVSERFPLTNTGKATVSDLEVIVAQSPYKAVVTFFTKEMVRSFVEESLFKAIVRDSSDKRAIFDALSEIEQGFRLMYIIGRYSQDEAHVSNKVDEYLNNIILLNNKFRALAQNDPIKYLNDDDYSETFRDEVYEDLDFKSIVEDIILEIIEKFNKINKGVFDNNQEDWPIYWEIETESRADFIESLRIFSTNHHLSWGQILTPLVQGMRIQGPFSPKISNELPKYIYIDGQGLEHINNAPVEVIPIKLEKMFRSADKILLVDSAVVSMTGSSRYALKAVIRDGYKDKLLIAFTHFELVDGEAFDGNAELRKDHVMSTVRSTLSSLGSVIGELTVNSYESEILKRCFFFSNLDKHYSSMEAKIKEDYDSELFRMFSLFQSKNPIPKLGISKPYYKKVKIFDEIDEGIQMFHSLWDMRFYGRLKKSYSITLDYLPKVHWKTMWAFNRRIVEFDQNEYSDLMPVSELSSYIKDKISVCLENPDEWRPYEPTPENKITFYNDIRANINDKMSDFIEPKMIESQMDNWEEAFYHSGRGSALLRATTIDHKIYDQVAPLSSSENKNKFMDGVWSIVNNSIDSVSESIKEKSLNKPIEPSNFYLGTHSEDSSGGPIDRLV